MLGWKLTLHEQNTVPGIVNRMLAARCDAVFTTYAITQTYMPRVSCQQTGFPLRRELLQALKVKQHSTNDNPHILVIGGSQGAKKVVDSCLAVFHQLSSEGMVFQATVQTGERNYAWAQEQNPPSHVCLVPFITDMATAYACADVMISRAGSGSLSEIALWQIPAILIPFPYASENHQKVNAEFFAREQAALMIEEKELTVERLKQDVSILLSQRDTRAEMSRRMASLRRTDAAAAIASELIRWVQQH
jgi:UDP-N-acetylglucosamine--N-acetylmuramyl-(pentapeptide) pyrophosphoryl-undecaprenol N-acetylglucosamine transferase